MTTKTRRPRPGERLGSPCPYTTEFVEGICGEPAAACVCGASLPDDF